MAQRMNEMKFKVTDEEKVEIEAAFRRSRYRTRAAYLRDCAVTGKPADLTEISVRIGQLWMMCNEVLADDEVANHRRLRGSDAKKAVKKITAACDAVMVELRHSDQCDHT